MSEPAAPTDIVPDTEHRGLIARLPQRPRDLAQLARFDRPIGWWLLFWPCVWGVWLAGAGWQWALLGWMLLGSIAMRGAGCVYNDIVDAKLDRQVARTASRPVASGRVSKKLAWGWLLFIANLLWTIAYDTLYAMVDRDDDVIIGIKSSAILFGRFDKLIVGTLEVIVLAMLAVVFELTGRGMLAYVGLAAAAVLFMHQHYNIRFRDRDACFKAFLDNHYVGMVVALGLAADYAFAL